MDSNQRDGFFSNLRYDLPAGLIVFLVAVPLCLGIALASGAPLFSGVIAGIVGGTIVTLVSGSPLGVSGPAAGLAVIVLVAIQELGFEVFLLAVMLSGLIQLIMGFAKAGVVGYFFPASVIKGMLAGIGVLIILKQIPHVFGYDGDPEGDFAFKQADGETTFSAIGQMVEFITPGVLLISGISLAILILWEQPFMKKRRLFQMVQGPLVVVVTGILLQGIFQGTSWAVSPDHMVALPVAENWSEIGALFTFPDFSQIGNGAVWLTAATLAVVASLETLLCVEATDKLDPYKRLTPTNRELKAQGLGNFFSGLVGGLPVTQVIVRSSANIQSGGRTKAASFFHGILLIFSALAIPFILNMIPLASLAAILIVVGYKLAKPQLFKEMYQLGWSQLIPFTVTIVGIVMTDLLTGIFIGMTVAIFYILRNHYKAPYFVSEEDAADGEVYIHLAENVTFLNKASIMLSLKKLPPDTHLIIDARHSLHVDYDVLDVIRDFKDNAKYKNITVEFYGLDPETLELTSATKKGRLGLPVTMDLSPD